MKLIQVLGTGCPKCVKLAENAQAAITGLDIEATVEKFTDINEITAFGVMMTPALVVVIAAAVYAGHKYARELDCEVDPDNPGKYDRVFFEDH